MTQPSDLQLATTQELVGELQSRFDHALFIGSVAKTTDEEPDTYREYLHFKGGAHVALGLAEVCAAYFRHMSTSQRFPNDFPSDDLQ